VPAADRETYVPTAKQPAGTYERLTHPAPPKAAPPPHWAPVDALAHLAILAGPWSSWGRGSALEVTPTNIVAALERGGVRLAVGPDGSLLVYANGRPSDAGLVALEAARPMLAAHLTGSPFVCGYPHPEPVPATTVALGGVAICDIATQPWEEPKRPGIVARLRGKG
jgi:hypothetical protein